ncbi:MAG: hypothetical protein RSC06_07245 [Clostridia bacterium]
MNNQKVYVPVTVEFSLDGRIIPRALHWVDGRTYAIDKVLDCKPAAAMRAGGCGDRFHVRINGQERYIFFERSGELTGLHLGRWFIEKQVS